MGSTTLQHTKHTHNTKAHTHTHTHTHRGKIRRVRSGACAYYSWCICHRHLCNKTRSLWEKYSICLSDVLVQRGGPLLVQCLQEGACPFSTPRHEAQQLGTYAVVVCAAAPVLGQTAEAHDLR
jgi:hypothetical protein